MGRLASDLLRLAITQPTQLVRLAAQPLRTPGVAWSRLRRLRNGAGPAIGYIGWVGHGNLGDEALFETVGLSLGEKDVVLIGPLEEEQILARLGLGIETVFRRIVLGGGTLIHTHTLAKAKFVSKSAVPLCTWGTGVGAAGYGASRDESISGWKEVLDRCLFVSVRGPRSQARLEEIGVKRVEVIGDPALSLAADERAQGRGKLAISLAEEAGTRVGQLEEALVAEAGSIAREFAADGGEVMGVALGPGDRRALQRFQAIYRVPGMRIQEHRHSHIAFFRAIAGSVGLIGHRLHAAVLANCLGIPAALFAYRPKCVDFMESMETPELAIPVDKSDAPDRLRECWGQILGDAGMGQRIHEKALSWKAKQARFAVERWS